MSGTLAELMAAADIDAHTIVSAARKALAEHGLTMGWPRRSSYPQSPDRETRAATESRYV
jgi:hypothetical protein